MNRASVLLRTVRSYAVPRATFATAPPVEEDPVKILALEFLRTFKSEVQKVYSTQFEVPEGEYKKAIAEVEAEKARLHMQSVDIQPRKKVSLKELAESAA